MKRNAAGRACSTIVISALCLWAQASRDDYRAAYHQWRDAEPTLELNAATAGETLASHSSHAATEEAKYGAARSAFLRRLAGDYQPSALSLQTAFAPTPPSPAAVPPLLRVVLTETSSLNSAIAAFAGDTDPVIRPLQQALERERSALAALNTAISDRQKAEEKAASAVNVLEQRRNNAVEQFQTALTAINASADSVDRETAAWAAYYQKLAESARAAAAPAAAPVSVSALNPASPPASPANLPTSQPAANTPAPRPPSITPLPLPRYTGAWTYSTTGGMFHGAEPEFVDLVVHEDNGKASGMFYARFKLPPGSTGDPLVRFDFSGDFRATRIQTFPLETSDGAKGSVDLIPGNAFNLLEVTFETEIKPGKIHLGDLLLVKK